MGTVEWVYWPLDVIIVSHSVQQCSPWNEMDPVILWVSCEWFDIGATSFVRDMRVDANDTSTLYLTVAELLSTYVALMMPRAI